MTLLVVGLSHRSAPVSVLERAALAPDARRKLLGDMLGGEAPRAVGARAVPGGPAVEAAVLSTCNRIELYAVVERYHAGVAELTALLARHSGVGIDELRPHLYEHHEDAAVRHLFSVACGLDSMVVGEGQILGQIKAALALAQDEHSAGRVLNELFQQALRVGKRAHSETNIDRAGQSLVTFGLQQLAGGGAEGPDEVAAWVAGKRALVIGAGSMSSLAAATLARAGVSELVIANRTVERAERLAASLAAGGDGPRARAVPINAISIAAELALADIVVSCTGATGLVLTATAVAGALRERARRCPAGLGGDGCVPALALLDLAMPRDVDAAVHELAGARLVDIESLAAASADAPMAADVDAVWRIVGEEVGAFGAARRAARITPTVVALREMASEVVAAELARLEGRLPELGDRERAEVARTVRRVVDKLLHAPTVRVKELAGEPGGAYYATALRQLFDLSGPEQAAPAEHAAEGGEAR
ncbi:glutamyl-tRNA reductase [Streptomyces hoynatensis]|uniref:Glutamyl-tRNA reductase n=1 Tax=Streptomyces hoynatensis TaxID=1141874 RepID=A0A3A9Z092_9ACTN|nr:glutamyl-tRNA reductase [Streptomyces hoynatensis]RKN41862.1 glutamyl-tRNA reductase [Streptomyces hoynatensis]